MYLQVLIDGLLLGGIYSSIALGLSLAFGVMGILNWAHGELMMLSMLFSYLLIKNLVLIPI